MNKRILSEKRKSELREEAGWYKNSDGNWKGTLKDIDVGTLQEYHKLLHESCLFFYPCAIPYLYAE